MKKAKFFGTIVGVLAFVALISGLTYAWFTWQSENVNIVGNSGCFNIDYAIGQEIGADSSESLKLGTSYTDGLSARVSVTIDSDCDEITGTGTLYLNTNTAGTSETIFGGALKYIVFSVNGDVKTPVEGGSGIITSAERKVLVSNLAVNNSTVSTFEVWVWLDGNLAGNSYADNTYSGYISLEVSQNSY